MSLGKRDYPDKSDQPIHRSAIQRHSGDIKTTSTGETARIARSGNSTMNKTTAAKIAGFAGALGASATLAAFAVGSTGAYFSDSHTGAINGTMGSIKVAGDGGSGTDHLGIVFADMLPGQPSSQTVGFTNTGRNTEDVYAVFDATALRGLNQLGKYGALSISVGGNNVFDSTNLNDGASCPASDANGPTGCKPLPHQLLLASSLAATGHRDMVVTFTPSDKFKGAALMEQQLVALPYTLVATQHGVSPSDVLNTTPVG